MVERICPSCQHANPLQDHYCGKCGSPLERRELARRELNALTIAGRSLPVTWKQVGTTAALSAAALVAEIGFAWLRRKLEQPASTTTALAKTNAPLAKRPSSSQSQGKAVTIVSQRVIEIAQNPDGKVQITDKHVWQKREE